MAKNHSFDPKHAKRYGLEEAVMIHSFQWWIERSRAEGRHSYEGRTWSFTSYKGLSRLFPYWTPTQVRRIVDSLVKTEVLIRFLERDNRTRYAFRDEEQFLDPLPESTEGGLPESTEGSAGIDRATCVRSSASVMDKGMDTHVAAATDVFSAAPPPPPPKKKPKPAAKPIGNPIEKPDPVEEVWLAFLATYPPREGDLNRQAGLKKFRALLRGKESAAAILEGARRFRAFCDHQGTTGGPYVPMISTWLNQRRWEDWSLPAGGNGSSPPRYRSKYELPREQSKARFDADWDCGLGASL